MTEIRCGEPLSHMQQVVRSPINLVFFGSTSPPLLLCHLFLTFANTIRNEVDHDIKMNTIPPRQRGRPLTQKYINV